MRQLWLLGVFAVMSVGFGATAWAGQDVLEGEINVIQHDNFKDGFSNTTYHVTGKGVCGQQADQCHCDKSTYTVKFENGAPEGLVSGTQVKFSGRKNGTVFVASAGGTTSGGTTTVASAPLVSGDQKTIVMLVNFSNSTCAFTPEDIRQKMFTGTTFNVDKYYREASYGLVSFSGDVVGPYTISYSNSPDNYSAWGSAADSAASSAGVNLSAYSRRVYVFAPCDMGGAAGRGTIGGNPSRSWLNGQYWTWTCLYTHEIGHNLLMHHSARFGGGEYEDHSCTMGNPSNPPHVNGPHKVGLGWIPSSNVVTVNQAGTFTLNQVAASSGGAQVLKILKGGSSTDAYYVSFRARTGFDGTLSDTYANKSSVHTWNGSVSALTYWHTALGDTQSFTDSANGITITQTAHTVTTSTVTVNMNARPVAVATATPTSGSAPLLVTLDGSGSNDPDGSIVAYAWTFGDGTTGTGATVTHTYNNPGTYTATLTVTDNAGAGNSTTVTITASDPNVINAPSGLSASVSGTTVTLTWNDNSNNETGFVLERGIKSGKGAHATISWSSLGSVGANVKTYTDSGLANGTYQYRVKAVNTSTGRESAWSNTAQATVGSKGRK